MGIQNDIIQCTPPISHSERTRHTFKNKLVCSKWILPCLLMASGAWELAQKNQDCSGWWHQIAANYMLRKWFPLHFSFCPLKGEIQVGASLPLILLHLLNSAFKKKERESVWERDTRFPSEPLAGLSLELEFGNIVSLLRLSSSEASEIPWISKCLLNRCT